MTTNTATPETTTDEDLDTTPVPDKFASKDEFEKGTWQATVQQASVLFKRSGDAKNKAGALLWAGAKSAISEWEADSDSDVNGEGLAHDLLLIMGTSRKGDVSKIKTVALAVLNNGLDTSAWDNLSKAYGEATRLTKTAKVEAEEDTAGVEAIEAVSADAPKTASTLEGAIKVGIALAQDFDEFFRVMLDVLNHGDEENVPAHKAALRSLAQEVSGRAKPAPAPATSTEGEDNKPAPANTGTAQAETAVKAPSRPRRQTAVPTETGEPTGEPLSLPNKKGAASAEEPDIFEEVDAEDAATEAAPTPAPAKKTSAPRPRRA